MKLPRQKVQRFVVFLALVAGMLIYVTSQWGTSGHRSAGSGSTPPPVSLGPSGTGSTGSGVSGTGSTGSGLSGTGSTGSGLSGTGSTGSGLSGSGSTGSGLSGSGSGSGLSGSGSTGSALSGAEPSGAGTPGSANPGTAAPSRPRNSRQAQPQVSSPASPPPSGSDYFTTARLDRERAQSQEIDLLKSVADNPQAARSARRDAGQKLIAVATRIRQEARAEDLLKAKGYSEALVFLDTAGATAIVRAPSLSETDVARIAETVTTATGVPASRVNILAER